MNVAFLYADTPQEMNCSIWRMLYPAQALRRAGHTARLFPLAHWLQRDPIIFQAGYEADVLVYERLLTVEVAEDMRYWKDLGKKIVVDCDDAYDLMPAHLLSWPLWHRGVKGHPQPLWPEFTRHLALADLVHTPSPLLCARLRTYQERVVWVPNYPDLTLPAWRQAVVRVPRLWGWGGSATHQLSWERSGVLAALRQRQVILFGGHTGMAALLPQAHYVGWMPHTVWPLALGQLSYGVAPLAGEYDQHRSWIKALEYGLRGIPWVASEGAPYQDVPGGLRVRNTPKAWREALNQIEHDTNLAQRLAQEGLAWSWQQGIDQHISERITLYQEIL
jgi:hypothetical protein